MGKGCLASHTVERDLDKQGYPQDVAVGLYSCQGFMFRSHRFLCWASEDGL